MNIFKHKLSRITVLALILSMNSIFSTKILAYDYSVAYSET